ncbi:MAG: alginate export family protein [Gammaproteobacteria bacterium]
MSAEAGTPWRLDGAAGLPGWFSLSGSQRTRYETLDGQFRAGRGGSDQMVALRTIVLAELRFPSLRIGLEGIDSRAYLDDRGSPLSTTMINPVELLQGYIAWDFTDLLADGDRGVLRAGRLTLDVGSRRFIARSKYRNTINTFTGFEWHWYGSDGSEVQAFYTLPVARRPFDQQGLRDNDVEFDEEDPEVRLWGLYYRFGHIAGELEGEMYVLGLDEDDAGDRRTRNRELYTPGFRLFEPPARGRFDWLVEAALQFGESRATALSLDTRDLDHFAHFEHFELGYSFDHALSPRLKFEFDYASGDGSPTDSENGRFDTLFGARRFEFGPTGIYGPFARSNLLTPGLRLNLRPAPRTALMLAYRGFWLASDTDAWTTTGVRDRSGDSGRFIAQQIEARVRYDVVPGNYRFEAGFAALFDGEFMRKAPNSPNAGDALYAYAQITLKF